MISWSLLKGAAKSLTGPGRFLTHPALGAGVGAAYGASESNRIEDIAGYAAAGAVGGAAAVPMAKSLIGGAPGALVKIGGKIGAEGTTYQAGWLPKLAGKAGLVAAGAAKRVAVGRQSVSELLNVRHGGRTEPLYKAIDRVWYANAGQGPVGRVANTLGGAAVLGGKTMAQSGGVVGAGMGALGFAAKHPTGMMVGGGVAYATHGMAWGTNEYDDYSEATMGGRAAAYRHSYNAAGLDGLVQGMHAGRHG